MKRVLSLDGGGVRGWFLVSFLVKLEKKLQDQEGNPNLRIQDVFDVFIGTSAGGIIAGLLNLPQRFSAEEIFTFFVQNLNNIFEKSWFSSLKSLEKPKYSAKGLIKLSSEKVGKLRLSEIKKKLIFTTFDLLTCSPMIISNTYLAIEPFKSNTLSQSNNKVNVDNKVTYTVEDFCLGDVLLATASAPTYFPPANVVSLSNNKYSFIDGGVIANNPALLGALLNKDEDTFLLSLGTGDEKKLYETSKIENGGQLDWILPLINILFASASDVTTWQCQSLLGPQFIRWNPPLINTSTDLDDISAANLAAMQTDFEKYIRSEKFEQELDKVCRSLSN